MKIDETGAYQYSHVMIIGNVGHCYTKAKDGEGQADYVTAIYKDELQPKAEESKKDDSEAGALVKAAEDKFKHKCLENYFKSDFETELDSAYKTTYAGVGGEGGLFTQGNVAVLEWNESNVRKTKWFTSGNGHSEKHILAFLKANNIAKEAVTRIYSELSPCAKSCLPALHQYFKGVKSNITLEFHWIHDTEKKYKTCDLKDANLLRLDAKNQRRMNVFKK